MFGDGISLNAPLYEGRGPTAHKICRKLSWWFLIALPLPTTELRVSVASTTDCTMTKQHRQHKKHHKHHHRHDEDHHHEKEDKDHHHDRKQGKKTIKNPLLKAVLEGVYDADCVLSKLRGCPHLLKVIWRDVRSHGLAQIRTPNKKQHKDRMRNNHDSEDEREGEELDKGI